MGRELTELPLDSSLPQPQCVAAIAIIRCLTHHLLLSHPRLPRPCLPARCAPVCTGPSGLTRGVSGPTGFTSAQLQAAAAEVLAMIEEEVEALRGQWRLRHLPHLRAHGRKAWTSWSWRQEELRMKLDHARSVLATACAKMAEAHADNPARFNARGATFAKVGPDGGLVWFQRWFQGWFQAWFQVWLGGSPAAAAERAVLWRHPSLFFELMHL